jgi:hypothetical protein
MAKRKRPAGRPMRRPRLTDAFYQRMIRNPDARIPFVLVDRT